MMTEISNFKLLVFINFIKSISKPKRSFSFLMINNKSPFGLFMIVLVMICVIVSPKSQALYSVGKLTVKNHSSQSAVNKTITLNTLSYYEHLPNLQMLKVRIVKANPFDGCSSFNSQNIFPHPNQTYSDTLLLVDGREGSCNYWRKAQMAKQALVKGIIIINDEPQKNGNRPADFADDGLFLSFLIRSKDASFIMPENVNEFQGQLTITYTAHLQEKKIVYLWISSLNQQSYEYLSWWNETLSNLPELKNRVQWEPKYVFYGHTSDQNRHVYSCICNGLFCSPQFHGKTADALIKQDLRQKLIFKHYPQKYLPYIRTFTDRCLQNYLKDKYAQECSKTQMINLEINVGDIQNKIYNLQNKCDQDKELFGQLLTDKGRFSMIGTYPIILLNRQILQINNQNQLQAIICRKLSLEQSEGCIQNVRTTTNEIVVSVAFFVLTLVGLFGVGFFIVMCYKNKLRKQMHKQVKMQVSTAVEHYFQLSEDATAKNG